MTAAKCGTKEQGWKMKDQEGMESQSRIVYRISPIVTYA